MEFSCPGIRHTEGSIGGFLSILRSLFCQFSSGSLFIAGHVRECWRFPGRLRFFRFSYVFRVSFVFLSFPVIM